MNRLPEADHGKVVALARSWRVPVVAVLGALAVLPLLEYVTGSVTLGLFAGNRERRELAATVGFVADLMPVPVRPRAGQDLAGLARDIAEEILDGQEHRVPLRAIRDLLHPRDGVPLFDVTLNYLPPLRQLNASSASGLQMSCSFIESDYPTRVAHAWYDGAAFIDYRWRVTDGRLNGYLDISGLRRLDAQTIVKEIGDSLGHAIRLRASHLPGRIVVQVVSLTTRHEALRTAFREQGRSVERVILRDYQPDAPVIDLSQDPEPERSAVRLAMAELTQTSDPTQPPL
jgi:hypothetical protein